MAQRRSTKDLRTLCGQPLIRYTIETAIRSNSIDYIAISNDDAEKLKLQNPWLQRPILRPDNLVTDKATIIPVIKHALSKLEELGYFFDAVLLLQPTNPLRTVDDIEKAVELLRTGKADQMSASKMEDHHPVRMKLIGSDGYLKSRLYKNLMLQDSHLKLYI